MKKYFKKLLVSGVVVLAFTPTFFLHAADMTERIQNATEILEKKQTSSDPIPASLLQHAKGVAIFKLTRAGLGIGGQGGEGIVFVGHQGMISHSWSAPSAFNLGGASIGAQIGYSETRYIVVLNTDYAVRHFTTSEKVDWNASATGTAGTDNATERASTSDLERREVVVYKDSGGVFGGATLGGTEIELKEDVNRQFYGERVSTQDIVEGKVDRPKSAKRLYQLLDGKK